MFLLFINDLPLELKNDIGIYADDSTLYASGSTLNEVEQKLKPDLEKAAKWAKENKMRMHQSKTKYNIICTRKKLANSSKQTLNLSLDDKKLSKVESERVLGVHIDSHLSWSVHIEELHRKLVKRISVLARVRKYLPTDYRLQLYNASIKSLFRYCCTVWSNCNQSHLDDLFKLQKRCAQLILDSPYTARSLENFQKLKWLPIDQLFLIDKICLLHRIIEGHVPEYLISKLESFRFQHQYSTKCKTDFRLPKPRNNSLKRTFFYSTIKSWNTFAIEDIQKVPLRTMKTNLCKIIMTKYTVDNFVTHKLF